MIILFVWVFWWHCSHTVKFGLKFPKKMVTLKSHRILLSVISDTWNFLAQEFLLMTCMRSPCHIISWGLLYCTLNPIFNFFQKPRSSKLPSSIENNIIVFKTLLTKNIVIFVLIEKYALFNNILNTRLVVCQELIQLFTNVLNTEFSRYAVTYLFILTFVVVLL
jgi:hypothetical protein